VSLSDLMSSFGLAVFAEVGLVVFFVIFLAVLARAALAPAEDMRDAARLALDDEPRPAPVAEGGPS